MADEKTAGKEPLVAELNPGDQLSHYRILDFLGAGSMGVVYKAVNLNVGRECVLKLLAGSRAGDPSCTDRFTLEARAAGKLHHPNIVQVYYVGRDGNRPFIEMEYVPGRTLKEMLIDAGPMEPLSATEIVMQVAEAMRVAHDEGIAHRDLKPGNIMITPQGRVKVMDFGLAKDLADSKSKTGPGQVVGTPLYMGPEVFDGVIHDLRSDIYSLGVTYYLMLTGHYPLRGRNILEMVELRRTRKPDPPHKLVKSIPLGVSYVILRMLAANPGERYPDAQSLLNEIKALHAFLKAEVGLVAESRLLAFEGEGACTSHTLGGNLCTVGRGPGNSIRVRDPRMSANHFRIISSGRRLIIEDLKSRNGTRLNGRAVEREELQHGDLVQTGGTLFLLQGTGEGRRTRQVSSIGGARLEPVGGGDVIPVGRRGFALGRAAAADVPLGDRGVAEYHVHIVLDGDQLLVHDLASGSGTTVNNARVKRKHMKSGDVLTIGETSLRFSLGRHAPEEMEDEAPGSRGPVSAPKQMTSGTLDAIVEPPSLAEETAPLAELIEQASREGEQPAPGTPPRGPCLVETSAAGTGRRFAVTGKPQIIGNAADADIRLDDRHVAGKHALVSLCAGGVELVDISGGEGIAVNGKPAGRAVLSPGDIIQLGGTRLELR